MSGYPRTLRTAPIRRWLPAALPVLLCVQNDVSRQPPGVLFVTNQTARGATRVVLLP
jgi:hypothetical protein